MRVKNTVYHFASNIKSLNCKQTNLGVIHANRSVVCALVSLNVNQVSPNNTSIFSLQSAVGRSSFYTDRFKSSTMLEYLRPKIDRLVAVRSSGKPKRSRVILHVLIESLYLLILYRKKIFKFANISLCNIN